MTMSTVPLTPSGLATVALLKTRLDQGLDHLALFEPFVADALNRSDRDGFIAADIKAVLHQRTGLLIPTDAMQTLLQRFVRKGCLRRDGGRFFRTGALIEDPDLNATRQAVEEGQNRLGEALVQFLSEAGSPFATADEALIGLATFVSDNKVHLLLDSPIPDGALERSSQSRKVTRGLARFISEVCLPSDDLRPILADLVEGILLEDALLLRDIGLASQRLGQLTVVLDTPVLFAALGLTGEANKVAAIEGLHLLREVGARTVVFEKTVAEMRRILAVYEDHLATAGGRLTLWPSDLTRHAIDSHMSSSDAKVISATLNERLRLAGVSVREVPAHQPEFTLDEPALQACLVDPRNGDKETQRIRHDVDCIAGVLTLRGGHRAVALEQSRFVFATTSGRVVRNSQAWYRAQGQNDFPPIIHYLALTAIAWLKKPAAAPGLKVHELAALCAGALRPTRETMEKTLASLRFMVREGVVSSDEALAVVASALLEPLLANLDDDTDPDSDSIADAIERVRRAYRDEAAAEAAKEVQRTRAEAAREREALEKDIGRATNAEQAARREAEAAARRAEEADRRATRVHEAAARRASAVAEVVSALGYWGGVLILVSGAALSIPGLVDSAPTRLRIGAGIVSLAVLGFGIWSSIRGGSLLSIKRAMRRRVRSWVYSKIHPTGGPDVSDL